MLEIDTFAKIRLIANIFYRRSAEAVDAVVDDGLNRLRILAAWLGIDVLNVVLAPWTEWTDGPR